VGNQADFSFDKKERKQNYVVKEFSREQIETCHYTWLIYSSKAIYRGSKGFFESSDICFGLDLFTSSYASEAVHNSFDVNSLGASCTTGITKYTIPNASGIEHLFFHAKLAEANNLRGGDVHQIV